MRRVRDADRRTALLGLDRAGRDRAPFAGRGLPAFHRARPGPRGLGRGGPAGPLQGAGRPLSRRCPVRRGAAERAADDRPAPPFLPRRAARAPTPATRVSRRGALGVAHPARRRSVGGWRLAAEWGGSGRSWGARPAADCRALLRRCEPEAGSLVSGGRVDPGGGGTPCRGAAATTPLDRTPVCPSGR